MHDHEHKCEYCVMTFSESFYLKLHMKSVHKGQNLNQGKIVTSIGDVSQIDFKCDLCEDSFVCAQDLKWHIDNIHEDLKTGNEEVHNGEKNPISKILGILGGNVANVAKIIHKPITSNFI